MRRRPLLTGPGRGAGAGGSRDGWLPTLSRRKLFLCLLVALVGFEAFLHLRHSQVAHLEHRADNDAALLDQPIDEDAQGGSLYDAHAAAERLPAGTSMPSGAVTADSAARRYEIRVQDGVHPPTDLPISSDNADAAEARTVPGGGLEAQGEPSVQAGKGEGEDGNLDDLDAVQPSEQARVARATAVDRTGGGAREGPGRVGGGDGESDMMQPGGESLLAIGAAAESNRAAEGLAAAAAGDEAAAVAGTEEPLTTADLISEMFSQEDQKKAHEMALEHKLREAADNAPEKHLGKARPGSGRTHTGAGRRGDPERRHARAGAGVGGSSSGGTRLARRREEAVGKGQPVERVEGALIEVQEVDESDSSSEDIIEAPTTGDPTSANLPADTARLAEEEEDPPSPPSPPPPPPPSPSLAPTAAPTPSVPPTAKPPRPPDFLTLLGAALAEGHNEFKPSNITLPLTANMGAGTGADEPAEEPSRTTPARKPRVPRAHAPPVPRFHKAFVMVRGNWKERDPVSLPVRRIMGSNAVSYTHAGKRPSEGMKEVMVDGHAQCDGVPTWCPGPVNPYHTKYGATGLIFFHTVLKVARQLHQVLPAADEFRRAADEAPRQCRAAVVGNGGSLLMYSLGAQIDEHDFVFRVSNPPNARFTEQVGRRTHYRVVDDAHVPVPPESGEALMLVPSERALEQYVELQRSVNGRLYLLDPEFLSYSLDFVDKVNPSVGMYAILLAAQMCRDVRLYGFWKDWSGLTPFRYYDRIEPAGAVAAHARRLEADAVLALVRMHNTTVRLAEPCADATLNCRGATGGLVMPCPNCPDGSQCQCGVPHPVPAPGFCYRAHGARGARAVRAPDVQCFHKCAAGVDCPGGREAFCSPNPARAHDFQRTCGTAIQADRAPRKLPTLASAAQTVLDRKLPELLSTAMRDGEIPELLQAQLYAADSTT